MGVRTKAEKFQHVPDSNLIFVFQASFVQILKPLLHLLQYLHVSAVVCEVDGL